MRIKLAGILGAGIAVAGAAPPELSLLAGSEIDSRDQSYSYLGFVGGKSLSERTRVLLKLWADYLTYSFPYGEQRVKAEAPAFQLAAGVGRTYGTWSFSLWSGWERRNTEVNPDLPGVRVKGVKDSLILQLEAYGRFENGTHTGFIVSYSSGTSSLPQLSLRLGD